ncbi:MAG: serine protease [Proteobacteria bacterium]|nr:serine protease [Pseudomonadota bacterium]
MRIIPRIFVIVLMFLITMIFCSTSFAGVSVEELAKTVVYIRQQEQFKEMKAGELVEVWYKKAGMEKEFEPKLITASGTGFIIKHNNKDYLVTAKHVAEFTNKENAEILLNPSNGNYLTIKFNDLKKYQIIRGARWFCHPIMDIALHPMAYPVQSLSVSAIPTELIAKTTLKIPLLSNVYIIGFPLGLGINDRIEPLAKKVQTASGVTSVDPYIRPDIKMILLDQSVAQGFSGSPVFYIQDLMSSNVTPPIKVGEQVHFIGVVSFGLPDISGGKLSGIVPVNNIWDILTSAEFKNYENSLPK